MHLLIRFSIASLVVSFVLGAFPSPAFACTPPPGGLPNYTVTDHVKAADVVVEGEILTTTGQDYPEKAILKVFQYLKGSGAAVIAIEGYVPESMCGTNIRAGQRGIFYIRTDQFGAYHPMQLGQFDAIGADSPENIAEASAAAGQEPIVIAQAAVDLALTQLAALTPGTATLPPTPLPYATNVPTLAPGEATFTPLVMELLAPPPTDTPRPPQTQTPIPPTATFMPSGMPTMQTGQNFDLFDEHWSPRIVGELNDSYVKLAKLQGEFIWHKHESEDELFLVVKGQLQIKLRDRDLWINAGEFVIIPKGVEHCPIAAEEVQVLLLEPKSTRNTGDKQNERTVEAK